MEVIRIPTFYWDEVKRNYINLCKNTSKSACLLLSASPEIIHSGSWAIFNSPKKRVFVQFCPWTCCMSLTNSLPCRVFQFLQLSNEKVGSDAFRRSLLVLGFCDPMNWLPLLRQTQTCINSHWLCSSFINNMLKELSSKSKGKSKSQQIKIYSQVPHSLYRTLRGRTLKLATFL